MLLCCATTYYEMPMDDKITIENLEKFKTLVSEIDISHYNQESFREIVNTIYYQIFIKEFNDAKNEDVC